MSAKKTASRDNGIGSFEPEDFDLGDGFDLRLGIDLGGEDGGEPFLDSIRSGAAGGVGGDSRAEQASALRARQTSDDIFSGLPSDIWQVDLMDGEVDLECAFDPSQEFSHAALNNLSVPRRSQRSDVITISEDDFEGPQRDVFLMLRDKVLDTYSDKVSKKRIMQAIEWVFCPLADGVSFDLACRALGMRPYVLRTRIHYEFYMRWRVFSAFPFLTVPVPAELQGEILYLTSKVGNDVARYIWYAPGITPEMLMAYVGQTYRDYEIEKAILDLEAAGIVGIRMNNIYLIGRNPESSGDRAEVEVNRRSKRSGFWSSYW